MQKIGVGILLFALFGTAKGSSVYVENAGLTGQTCVGSQRVVHISAGFMIFFSVLVADSHSVGLSLPQYFNEYTAIKGYVPAYASGRWESGELNGEQAT